MPEPLDKKQSISCALQEQLEELRRRVLGYTFGGPPSQWCDGDSELPGILLPPNPLEPHTARRILFRGCEKYQSCDLIPDEVRWKTWEVMTDDERDSLRSVGCYRASRADVWDVNALPSRQNTNYKGEWIGNPFGLRTTEVVHAANNPKDQIDISRLHRDYTPCPVGGCITPEMQRTFEWKYTDGSDHVGLCHTEACPFHYRHTGDTLIHAEANPLRFAQCHVTKPHFRQLLEDNGIVVVAPVHRSPEGRDAPGESYWYPFYAGYAFLQVPSRAPIKKGFLDCSLTVRWLLTRLERENLSRAFRRLPIRAVFEAAEKGMHTTSWEKRLGIISVSEGQASFFLLQWILCRRMLAMLSKADVTETLSLTSKLEWVYAGQGEAFHERLSEIESLGFELQSQFGLSTANDGSFVRVADFRDDLALLGLIDENDRPTRRFECSLLWLKARIAWADKRCHDSKEDTLDDVVASRLGSLLNDARYLCEEALKDKEHLSWALPRFVWLLISIASGQHLKAPRMPGADWHSMESIKVHNPAELTEQVRTYISPNTEDTLFGLCSLVPAMHILVRSGWHTPLRWLFVPLNITAYVPPGQEQRVGGNLSRISSGLIIMLEDNLQSLPYQVPREGYGENRKDDDIILERLERTLPYLSSIADAELACLQDDIVQAYREWEMQEPRFAQVVHFLREVAQDLRSSKGEDADSLRRVVNILSQQFFIRPGPAFGSPARSVHVEVDAVKAANEAVAAFNAYYIRHYSCTAVFNELGVSEEPRSVKIKPYDQKHDGRKEDQLSVQGYYSLIWILLDMLAQRAPYAKGKTLRLCIRSDREGELTFEVQVPGRLTLEWEYPRDSLSRFSGRRGFYNLFANAIALGCPYAAIIPTKYDQPALLRLSFYRR